MRKKAYVLSGGGVLSAYQVGVLSQLRPTPSQDQKVKFFGVSGGSLASIAYSYLGAAGSVELYRTIKHRKDLFGYNILNLVRKDALYTHKPLRKMLERVIMNFDPDFEVSVGNVDLGTGLLHHWPNTLSRDVFVKMATASACIPGMVEPYRGYADGGIIDNTPLKRAIQEGYTDITVILTEDPTALPPQRDPAKMNVLDILMRSYELMRHDAFREDLQVCVARNNGLQSHDYQHVELEVYALGDSPYGALEFTPAAVEWLLEEGMNARPSY